MIKYRRELKERGRKRRLEVERFKTGDLRLLFSLNPKETAKMRLLAKWKDQK